MYKSLAFLLALSWVFATAGAEKFASLGTNKVSYSISGAGSNTVVLIHGWGGNKEVWRGQIPDLERDYRVIAIDLPGFGKSDKPKTNYTMRFLAEGVNVVLKDAKVENAVLVGFSMGASVMSAFYQNYREKVAGLVSIDGTMRGFNIPPDRLEEIVKPFRTEEHHEAARKSFASMFPIPGTEKLRDEVTDVMLKTPAYVLHSSLEEMFNGGSWQVSEISVPLLLVMNAQNPTWTDDYKEFVRKVQPKAIFKGIEGTGHFVHLEKSAEVNAILREFLSSVFSGKRS